MTMPHSITGRIPLEALRDRISDTLAMHVKSYNLPTVCDGLGLSPGTSEEAQRSKRIYVKTRILTFGEPELLKIAQALVTEFGDEQLSDWLVEVQIDTDNRLSEISRRDVLKVLNGLDTLFGDIDVFDGLAVLLGKPLGDDEDVFGLPTLAGRIRRHYVRNDDWSHEDLLIECGALTCTQACFFRFLKKVLDPVVRRGESQTFVAAELNKVLVADGFHAVVVGQKSRHPLYEIERTPSGVAGKPKNIIFAAVDAKPDLHFTDAINNDVAIRNASDALIYDEFLLETGLRWETLARWWQTKMNAADISAAKRGLYSRLMRSIRVTQSPGQYAIFYAYYREFAGRLNDALPALIPEVYLHYDPRTRLERGANPVVSRQRMDFLLLLDQGIRIVIEVDGHHHYSDSGRAAPSKYAEMVMEDRRLRLAGYELYRFGGAEFSDCDISGSKFTVGPSSYRIAIEFFDRLFLRHKING